MKKHVLTIAGLMMASSLATAATSSQSANDFSASTLGEIIAKVASTSNKSVKFSTESGEAIENAREAVQKEATQQIRKGGVIHTAAGSMSAVGAFTIFSVETVVEAGTSVTKWVFEGVQSGSRVTLISSQTVAVPVAKGVDASAQGVWDGVTDGAKYVGGGLVSASKKVWNIGEGVVVGISASGIVMIDELGKAEKASSKGQLFDSASLVLGSVVVSGQALGAEVVKGYRK